MRPSRLVSTSALRLVTLCAALVLVLAAQQRLGTPQAEQAIAQVFGGQAREVAPSFAATPIEPALGPDGLATIRDNSPFRDEEQAAWFALIDKLLNQSPEEIHGRSMGRVGYAQLVSQPDAYRAQAVTIVGSVKRVEQVEPAENELGLGSLWRIIMQPEGGGVWPITVYALEAPANAETPFEASVTGYFFKNLSYRWEEGVGVTPVVLATRLESPDRARKLLTSDTPSRTPDPVEPPDVETGGSMGRALLAQLGVDPAAYDDVEDLRSLTHSESQPFYATLAAVEQTPPSQLVRLAQRGLTDYATRQQPRADASDRDRLVAREVERQAEEGRYSVAPLFDGGDDQRGELVVIDAVVRRVTRVVVDPSTLALPESDRIDHYYQLEAFADDSQNLPLVFCMLELPAGFPVGDEVRQPARLAGFFFKRWAYRPRSAAADERQRSFAPLLIGRAPIPIVVPKVSRPGITVGAAGVLLLVAAVLWLWRAGHGDRAYEARTLRRLRDPQQRDFSRLS